MSSESPLAWLGRQKEKRALKLCERHLGEIVDTAEAMRDTVHLFCENGGEIRSKAEGVMDKERVADKTKSEILEELSKENFPPLSRENIVRLIMTADDIADNARAASMKLTFLDPESVGTDVKRSLKKLSDYAYESTVILREAFSATLEDPKSVKEQTAKVEEKEEEVDNFRAEKLIPQIVKWADESHKPGTSFVIAEVEDNIEEVVDQSENCADVIREIAIGSE